jgi:hypothetical protein
VYQRVLRCLLVTSLLVLIVGSFDEFAVDEGGAGPDEGDQVGCVDHSPPGLGGLDQLERHRDPGSA